MAEFQGLLLRLQEQGRDCAAIAVENEIEYGTKDGTEDEREVLLG